MKIYSGDQEVEVKTDTERLLAAALAAILFEHGQPGSLKDAPREFYLHRYALIDAVRRDSKVQICTDTNNGRDLVRLKR